MREIKFRGKRIYNGEWVFGDYSRYSKVRSIIMVDSMEREGYWVSSDTVGQHTGLKDKNGVEIYEGDVLDFTVWDAWDNDTQYIGVVKFEQGEWQIWNSEQSEFYDADGAFNLFWVHEDDMEIKIIGNIHENPELLEVGR